MDSDDQESVYSLESGSSKSVIYDSESSSCDTLITSFDRCNVKVEKDALSSISEEIEEIDISNDSVAVVPSVKIFSFSHEDKTTESIAIPLCNNKEDQKTRDNSTNTENCGYKRKMFGRTKNTNYKYRPYGCNHKHLNYQHNNYYPNSYQRPFHNNQQKYFSHVNRYQNYNFCNKWNCEMRHRENEHFKDMLFRGIFHFTKFLEYIAQTHS